MQQQLLNVIVPRNGRDPYVNMMLMNVRLRTLVKVTGIVSTVLEIIHVYVNVDGLV